ncbi:MAG: YraN family protein [Desulfotalea sp.]|nr:MAG: YraN family protein [Desulfotalea sp.]
MVNFRQILGQKGESIAAIYLKNKGYSIVKTNYRCNWGEIDLIARDGNVLIFVEVKTRTNNNFGGPTAAVDLRKQQQISKVAHHYLVTHHKDDIDARFDVVSILAPKDKKTEIQHITNAFDFCIS